MLTQMRGDDDLLDGDIRVGGRRAHTAALPAPPAAPSGGDPATQRRHPGSLSIEVNKQASPYFLSN